MSRKTELAKNTAILTVGKLCTQCISFFLLPLYTEFCQRKSMARLIYWSHIQHYYFHS